MKRFAPLLQIVTLVIVCSLVATGIPIVIAVQPVVDWPNNTYYLENGEKIASVWETGAMMVLKVIGMKNYWM